MDSWRLGEKQTRRTLPFVPEKIGDFAPDDDIAAWELKKGDASADWVQVVEHIKKTLITKGPT